MKPIFNGHRVRVTAAVTLFLWLLASSIGIANACLLAENHARHGHLNHHDDNITLVNASGALALVDGHASEEQATQLGGHSTEPARQACQIFCSTEQLSAGKPLSDVPVHLDFFLGLPSVTLAAPWSDDKAVRWLVLNHPPGLDPPVFIRFLRLTI